MPIEEALAQCQFSAKHGAVIVKEASIYSLDTEA